VHFLGKIPYARYLALLQVSSVHLYLTVPFVLSWSCLEAMAAGCVLVASDTAPVREVIEDGRNGYLVDFFSPAALAAQTAELLADRRWLGPIREAARRTVLARYALEHCLPRQAELVMSLG
jgi:glycosyltransferase involved in cell wall biosynthesis